MKKKNPLSVINGHKYVQVILFFFVGGINTMFGYSLYALLLFINLHYALASFLATIGGVLFNFKTTGTIVFRNSDNKLLYKFVLVYCFTYFVNVLFLRAFYVFEVNMYLAGAIMVVPVALLSYTLLNRFVFGGDNLETNKHRDTMF